MKRLIPVILALCLLLCGCNGAEEPATTAAPTTEATVPPTTEATVPPTTEAPTEPPVVYRHPLTGEALDEPFAGRVVTFTIGNTYEALPQHGLSKADVLYEITVEGGLTRCMPLFTDGLSEAGPIGSIRSARTYFVSISRAYNAVFIHSGASVYAASLFNGRVVDHVNGEPSIFYRDSARRSAGYAVEHTHFTTGEKALAYLNENFDMAAGKDGSYGFSFVDEQTLDGQSANTVQVNFGTGYAKITNFTYDEAAGNYTAYQQGGDWIDANTEEVLRFENLLILYAKKSYAPGTTSGNVLHELVGENTGYYISGGKVVPIMWSREAEDAPFVYTLEDGSPLNLIPGKTYVGVVPPNSPITCE